MTFTINKVLLAGRISDYGPKLSYLPSGKPELSFTLIVERPYGGKVYKTYVPVQVYGNQAEPLAESLEAGDLVMVDGTLGYRADRRTGKDAGKDKRPATLAVSTFNVEVLQPAEVKATTAERGT